MVQWQARANACHAARNVEGDTLAKLRIMGLHTFTGTDVGGNWRLDDTQAAHSPVCKPLPRRRPPRSHKVERGSEAQRFSCPWATDQLRARLKRRPPLAAGIRLDVIASAPGSQAGTQERSKPARKPQLQPWRVCQLCGPGRSAVALADSSSGA